MKLYWGSGSPVSWRVQIALALKGTPYTSHRLDLGAREHRGEAYRNMNPKGTFPLLTDGELVVRESLAILAYLERKYPEPALFGDAPEQHAMIWQQVIEHDKGLAADADIITRALFREGGLGNGVEAAREAVERAKATLTSLNRELEAGPWLAGPMPSALEVVNYPTLHRLLRAASKPRAGEISLDREHFDSAYPAVMAWAARMQARPGIDETYPPHWRE